DLERFLLCGSARLAALAQYGLKRRGADWRAVARANLTAGDPKSVAAAKLLARNADPADGVRMRELAAPLSHANALTLLTAATKLGDDLARERLRSIALEEPDLAVARRATNGLMRAGDVPPVGKIVEAVERREFHSRGLAKSLRLLPFFSRIEVLCALE